MVIELNTKISIGDNNGKGIPNLLLEDAKFWGRPNFSGELDRFKDDRRKFTVLIPLDVAEQLKAIGYNVKVEIPNDEERAAGREDLAHLKVVVDMSDEPGKGAQVFLKQGDELEKLSVSTAGVVDRCRFEEIGMEIRGWEYNPEEHPGQYSARLVQFVGVMPVNPLEAKYGKLR